MNRRGFFKAACGVVLGLLGVKAAKAEPVVGIAFGSQLWKPMQNWTCTYNDIEVDFIPPWPKGWS